MSMAQLDLLEEISGFRLIPHRISVIVRELTKEAMLNKVEKKDQLTGSFFNNILISYFCHLESQKFINKLLHKGDDT